MQDDSVTFSIGTQGLTALSYQWFKNSNQLPVTSSQYSISSCQLSDAGSYYCVVRNSNISLTSNIATLRVDTIQPNIILEPESAISCQQTAVSFQLSGDQQSAINNQLPMVSKQ